MLIEVSRLARTAIEALIGGPRGKLSVDHLPTLRAVLAEDLYSSEPALLIAAVERDGESHIRFI